MNHLSEDALLEIVEAGQSHPHLAACERCRHLFEEARDALALARGEEMPEPSPLFWDHFSARVRAATENEVPAPASLFGWLAKPVWRPVAMVVLFAIVAAAGAWRLWPAHDTGEVTSSATPAATAPVSEPIGSADVQPAADLLEPAGDSSWLVIAQVTAHVEAGHVADAGLVLQPDATERAISQLTPSEQQELVRLLQNDPAGTSQ